MLSADQQGTSDRASLALSSPHDLDANCRDVDTREWFKAALARSEDRMGQQLTHEEFTRLLLQVYEFHETREVSGE